MENKNDVVTNVAHDELLVDNFANITPQEKESYNNRGWQKVSSEKNSSQKITPRSKVKFKPQGGLGFFKVFKTSLNCILIPLFAIVLAVGAMLTYSKLTSGVATILSYTKIELLDKINNTLPFEQGDVLIFEKVKSSELRTNQVAAYFEEGSKILNVSVIKSVSQFENDWLIKMENGTEVGASNLVGVAMKSSSFTNFFDLAVSIRGAIYFAAIPFGVFLVVNLLYISLYRSAKKKSLINNKHSVSTPNSKIKILKGSNPADETIEAQLINNKNFKTLEEENKYKENVDHFKNILEQEIEKEEFLETTKTTPDNSDEISIDDSFKNTKENVDDAPELFDDNLSPTVVENKNVENLPQLPTVQNLPEKPEPEKFEKTKSTEQPPTSTNSLNLSKAELKEIAEAAREATLEAKEAVRIAKEAVREAKELRAAPKFDTSDSFEKDVKIKYVKVNDKEAIVSSKAEPVIKKSKKLPDLSKIEMSLDNMPKKKIIKRVVTKYIDVPLVETSFTPEEKVMPAKKVTTKQKTVFRDKAVDTVTVASTSKKTNLKSTDEKQFKDYQENLLKTKQKLLINNEQLSNNLSEDELENIRSQINEAKAMLFKTPEGKTKPKLRKKSKTLSNEAIDEEDAFDII